jgi:prepilin-type N-terminal cleavage/methylation domain-containing protein
MHPSDSPARGFTLLEVMVSVAILALAVVPMLLTREHCYDMAYNTKNERTIQELAQRQLAYLALNVIRGEGAGEVEGAPDYFYEYTITIYDFRSGLEEDEDEINDRETGRLDTGNAPRDAVFADEDTEDVGPHMARHVILKLYAVDGGEEKGKEFVLDTYIPLLMTKEQFDNLKKDRTDEE